MPNTRYGGADAKISPLPQKSALRRLMERLFPEQTDQDQENNAFLQLAVGGDKTAAQDPRSRAAIKLAAMPNRASGLGGALTRGETDMLLSRLGPADEVTLYSGGPSQTFWTTQPERAASYIEPGAGVRMVKVPRAIFEEGQRSASQLGQPSRFDTVLGNEWVKRAVDAPHIKAPVTEAEAMDPAATDQLLSSLGVKRF